MFWLGDRQWGFYLQFEKAPEGRALTFQDNVTTLQFLFAFRNDTFALVRFRALLPASGRSGQRLTDEQLLRRIAKQLLSGELRVSRAKVETYGGRGTPPDPAVPKFNVSERRKYEPPPPPKKEDEFFPDADLVAIAAVLKAAAESGTPFCEECARKAAAAGAGS